MTDVPHDNGSPVETDADLRALFVQTAPAARPVDVDALIARAARVRPRTGDERPVQGRRRWVVGLVSAAALLVAAVVWLSGPTTAWAQVIDAVMHRPWFHMTGQDHAGRPFELWFSKSEGLLAQQLDGAAMLVDLKQNVQHTYRLPDASDNRVYRLPLDSANQWSIGRFGAFIEAALTGNVSGLADASDRQIVDHRTQTVERDGATWIEHRLSVRDSENSEPERTVVLDVDPATRLPMRMAVTQGTGDAAIHWKAALDYPATGPLTIYALNVPESAEVVDRVPHDDLQRVLAGVERSRRSFDAYRAVVVEPRDGDPHSYSMGYTLRLWRTGRQWRVEQCRIPYDNGLPKPPAEADPQEWWQQSAERWKAHSLLRSVSDGESECRYNAVPSETGERDPQLADYVLIESFQKSCQTLMGDDPVPHNDWYMFPCFRGYPAMYDATRWGWTTTLDPRPATGPKGTVLVECRKNGAASGNEHTVHRYWIDPNQSHLVLREEFVYGDPENPTKTSVIEVAEVGRTPSGLSYPKLVRLPNSGVQLETGATLDSYVRFNVEFGVEMPEGLFASGGE